MVSQAVDRKRCGSCERWSGERQPGDDGRSVLVAAETSVGLCRGGPWDGSDRRARSACGHWQCWAAVEQAASGG